jgi:protein-L-isoaspartate O-methyltransferase
MTDWQARAAQLAATLVESGALTRQWQDAFTAVPRHIFVPRFFRDDGSTVDGSILDQEAEWLDTVYSDTSLTTQLAPVPSTDQRWPTSSSTMPSLMARMLALLHVTGHEDVLEIGTGTGYNAALLSHRLGDAQVSSVDLDPALVSLAADRLASLGYQPMLTATDGTNGLPERAPFDRIIATCAVLDIPDTWIEQLRSGGLAVVDVRGDIAGSLVVARKTGPDTLTGGFLGMPGHFMWLRREIANPLRTGDTTSAVIDHDDAEHATTTLDPAILDTPGFQFAGQISDPHAVMPSTIERSDGELVGVYAPDAAWAEIDTTAGPGGQYRVAQGGPRRIWDTIEAVAATWNRYGRPDSDRFGFTTRIGAEPAFWIDDPDNPWQPDGNWWLA